MAIRVTILKDLEKRLRACSGGESAIALVREVVALMDEETRKREIGSLEVRAKHLGYKELVSLFRLHLGSDLVLPPSPSESWIIKNIALAKNMGVSKDNVEQICRGLRRTYPRGPYQLGFVLGRADIYFSAGDDERLGMGRGGGNPSVRTGRLDDDEPDE